MERKAEDELVLIDYVLGRLDGPQRDEVKDRLARDESFQQLLQDVTNTLSAVGLYGDAEPPRDLVARTMARIAQEQQIKRLVARQEIARRPFAPTFSLRELAAIAAMALIMAVIFVPSMRQAKRSELAGRCAAQVGQVGSALLNFANENQGTLPLANPKNSRWLAADANPWASNSAALFQLIRRNYASPVVFQCPAVGGESFVVQAGMGDFPAGRYVSYSYQYSLGKTLSLQEPCLAGHCEQMAILADSTPVFINGQFLRDRANDEAVSENHDRTGQNVLFLDGHVDWTTRATVGVSGDNIFLAQGVNDYTGNEAPTSPIDSFLLPAFSGGR